MTNYKFAFKTENGTTEIIKAFDSYMKAMNFKAEYFATHRDVYYATMVEI